MTPAIGDVHPSAAAYRRGCRCDPCRALRYRYAKRHRVRSDRYGKLTTSADATRERLTAWKAEGFFPVTVALAVGLNPATAQAICAGNRSRVLRVTEAAVLGVTRADLYAKAPDAARVPAVGAVRRLLALRALGWRMEDVHAAPPRHLEDLILGNRYERISAALYRAVAAEYDRLSMVAGPSEIARRRAKDAPPPLAWDDDAIDDPAATPWRPSVYGVRSGIDPDDVAYMLDCAEHPDVIASRLGVQLDSVYQQLRRLGRDDLRERLIRARRAS